MRATILQLSLVVAFVWALSFVLGSLAIACDAASPCPIHASEVGAGSDGSLLGPVLVVAVVLDLLGLFIFALYRRGRGSRSDEY